MEKIKRSLAHRAKNPIVKTLSKHLMVEAVIFRIKNDFYSSNWAMAALVDANVEIDITKNDINELEKEAKEIIDGKYNITSELVVKFALCERIMKLTKKRNQYITESMKTLLDKSRTMNWLNSQETTSMLLFLLEDCGFDSELDEAYEWLLAKNRKFIHDRNYPNAVDSSLGLLSYKGKIELPFDEIVRNMMNESIERISKLLLCIVRSDNKEYLNDLIMILEDKLENKFKNWIFPSMETNLFEILCLVYSNIPKQNMCSILDNLRKDSKNWASFIDITNEGILLKKVDSGNLSYFNPKEDALSLLALLKAKRDTIYQLSEEEYEMANTALREHRGGYTGIKKSQLQYLFVFSLCLISLFFIISIYSLGILSDLNELLENPSFYFLVKKFRYYVIFIILAVYYCRIGLRIIHCGEISRKDIILLLPFVDKFYSMIGGSRNDE